MSGLGNEVQIEAIIERIMLAMEERRRIQEANQPTTGKLLGVVPPWFAVVATLGAALVAFGSLRSDVATAKDQSAANKDAISAIAPRLTGIETDVRWLVEERKRAK